MDFTLARILNFGKYVEDFTRLPGLRLEGIANRDHQE